MLRERWALEARLVASLQAQVEVERQLLANMQGISALLAGSGPRAPSLAVLPSGPLRAADAGAVAALPPLPHLHGLGQGQQCLAAHQSRAVHAAAPGGGATGGGRATSPAGALHCPCCACSRAPSLESGGTFLLPGAELQPMGCVLGDGRPAGCTHAAPGTAGGGTGPATLLRAACPTAPPANFAAIGGELEEILHLDFDISDL